MSDSMAFECHVGIDYSGAETPTSSLKGLRVYVAEQGSLPREVFPPPSPRKYWTRAGIAEWLARTLAVGRPALVGLDHGFSFPIDYFRQYGLPLDWDVFLEDFCRHRPTYREHVYVDFVRDGLLGNAAARSGSPRWKRLAEKRARGAKSVFHFDVTGSVAKSTHSGLPWLLHLRRRLHGKVHFWPFDGWGIPSGMPAVVEVYPALWSRSFPGEGRDPHQHDAYSIAAWMQQADSNGTLGGFLNPQIEPGERRIAEIEGWILGVA